MRASAVAVLALLTAGTAGCVSSPGASYPGQYPLYKGPPAGAQGAPPAYPGQPAAAMPGIFRPINLAALQGLLGTRCAPREVAPGEYATLDCGLAHWVSRAVAYLPKMSLLGGPLPLAVDHRTEGTEGPIKSQGAVGACTAFSLSSTMDNAVRRMGRGDVVAALHVWSKYGIPEMGTAGEETVDKTLALEPSWPYDPVKACKLNHTLFDSCGQAYGVSSGSASADPVLQAEKASADAQGRYRLASIERLHAHPADLNEMAAILAGGDDVWAAFSVDGDAWSARSLQGNVIPDYSNDTGEGHAVTLAGYRTLPNGARQFLVHNSWGTRWGEQGYGWISEGMVSQWLRSAYKIKVTDSSSPAGPFPPSSDGCPAGQVKDAVLGTCTAPCASGSAPAAGVCLPALPGFPAPGKPAPGQPAPTSPFPFALPPGLIPPGLLPPGFPQLGPPGQPAPAPANACPAGQAPDLMTGQCIGLCPGGHPAMGGMCLPFGQ
ncbi:MAG: C1 family peptidase [Byssovorax sp.]